MPYYTPPCYTAYIIPDAGNNAFFLSNEEKEPTQEQLRAGKGVGSILWSKKTGGPRHIRGNLTAPSREDPQTIARRFLKEKKVLYGIKDPDEDLGIKTIINGRYDTTIHFQQMYKNIPVEAYLVVSILPNGVIHAISGEYYADLDVNIIPMVSAKKAGQISSRHGQKHDARVRELPEIPDSLTPELLIRPSQGKNYLLWHFTGRGGWEYYIDAHDETIRNAISPIRNSFQPATGTIQSTKDLPEGAVVSFHLNDEINPRYAECPLYPEWDPNWGTPYIFEDDLSTGTIKVMVYNAFETSNTQAHCEECDIYSCCGYDPDPNCSCPAEGCCSCDPNWCKAGYPCISYSSFGLDLPYYYNQSDVSAIYYTGKVYEFYKENFGLDGYKGDGSETRVVINYIYTTGDPTIACYDSLSDSIALGYGCGPYDQNCLQTLGCKNLAGALDTILNIPMPFIRIPRLVYYLILVKTGPWPNPLPI